MYSQNSHPKWWQVYLTFPLLIAAFALDNRLKISARGHQAVQIGIVLLIYMLVHLWLKANSSSLSRIDQRGKSGNYRVLQMRPAQLPESKSDRLLQLPEAEVKGMLSNTFEMDYIDAEFFSIEDEEMKE